MTTHPGLDRSVERGSYGFLRSVMKLDASATGAVGVLMLLAAGTVIGVQRPFVLLLGVPPVPLASAGAFLIVYAAFAWFVGSRRRVNGPAAWAAVWINAAYAAGCVVVAAAGLFQLTALGVAFVLAQALAIALFAALQILGLRRGRRTAG